jgi:hypothetical protein
MSEPFSDLRSIRVRMLGPGVAEQVTVARPVDHEERLAAHERRIHDHSCECGSGKRYVDCCIDRMDQGHLELRHRLRMAARRRQRQEAST